MPTQLLQFTIGGGCSVRVDGRAPVLEAMKSSKWMVMEDKEARDKRPNGDQHIGADDPFRLTLSDVFDRQAPQVMMPRTRY